MLRALAFLAAISLQAAEPAKLYFEVPKDAKKEDAAKAAKALQTRVAGYGFKGISAAVEPRGEGLAVVVTSEIPFTQAARNIITKFATRPATSVELRVLYPMSGAEEQQYGIPNAAKLKDALSPPGSEWSPVVDTQLVTSKEESVLLRKELRLSREEFTKPKPGDKKEFNESENPHYKLTDSGRKKMVDAKLLPHGQPFRTTILWLAIDGAALPMEYTETPKMEYDAKGREVKWIRSELYLRNDVQMFGVIDLLIQNPLPFALKPETK